MKMDIQPREIEKFGANSSQTFSIKSTGKAFMILSSNLYKDKVTAVIREICANAYDAHVANNCAHMPFIVHLPTSIEPYFSVEDRGPGLSAADVMTVYTTFFESTKDQSNDFVGTLGLGCKVPFSVTDTFQVISVHGGFKRNYCMFINEQQIPEVMLMSEVQSEDPTGLTVYLDVNPQTVREYREKAREVLRYFPVFPDIQGNTLSVENRNIVHRGTDFKIYDRLERSTAMAVMGCVAYPISSQILNSKPRIEEFLNLPLEIQFPIGSLQFTPGREDLSYDSTTIQNLKEKIEKVIAEIEIYLSGILDQCRDEYTAIQKYLSLKEYPSAFARIISRDIVALQYHGTPVSEQKIITENMVKDFPDLKFYRIYRSRRNAIKVEEMSNDNGHHLTEFGLLFKFKKNQNFYIVDCTRWQERIKKLAMSSYESTYFAAKCSDPLTLSRFIERFGGASFAPTSGLSLPTRERGADGPKEKTKAKVLSVYQIRSKYGFDYKDLTSLDVEMSQGGYYFPVDGRTTYSKMNLYQTNTYSISTVVLALYSNGLITDKTICVVPKTVSAAFINHPKWKNALDTFYPLAVKISKDEDFLRKLSLLREIETLSRYGFMFELFPHLTDLESTGKFDALKPYVEINKEEIENKQNLVNAFKLPLCVAPENHIDKIEKEILKKYPLLEFIKFDKEGAISHIITYLKGLENV